jgi:NCAIR mutase (PurE)-related protein
VSSPYPPRRRAVGRSVAASAKGGLPSPLMDVPTSVRDDFYALGTAELSTVLHVCVLGFILFLSSVK